MPRQGDDEHRVERRVTASGGNDATYHLLAAELGGQRGGGLAHDSYLDERSVEIGGRTYIWHALVHPAVRPPWTDTHSRWREAHETAG